MANLNKVLLIGNLTKDPEVRYLQSGLAIANMRLAVNRYYTDQSGEKKQETCYLSIIAWKRLAELCGEYLSKGKSIFVEGRLQNRSWETESGEKKNILEVIADKIQFLDRSFKENSEVSSEIIETEKTEKTEEKDKDLPF